MQRCGEDVRVQRDIFFNSLDSIGYGKKCAMWSYYIMPTRNKRLLSYYDSLKDATTPDRATSYIPFVNSNQGTHYNELSVE